MKIHFEENKKEEFKKFNERGKELRKGIIGLEAELEKNEAEKKSLEEKFLELKSTLSEKETKLYFLEKPELENFEEYINMREKISVLESEKDRPADISGLNEEINKIKAKVNELQNRLSKRELIAGAERRIRELEKSQRQLAQKKADLDKFEFDMEKFVKFKIENFENAVNSMFKIVKFKLFETQINGSETECCKATVNGVPYSDLNNAMKINAGIDIINTLSEKYEVYAPIFIDNRESINNLIDCGSQIINLIVSKDEILRVEAD